MKNIKKRYKFNPFLGQSKKNSRLNFIVSEIFFYVHKNGNKLDGLCCVDEGEYNYWYLNICVLRDFNWFSNGKRKKNSGDVCATIH